VHRSPATRYGSTNVGGHLKTSQRNELETMMFLVVLYPDPASLFWFFNAWTALEHMVVMEETVEHSGYRSSVAESFPQSFTGRFEVTGVLIRS
jgi:hypothetical protein